MRIHRRVRTLFRILGTITEFVCKSTISVESAKTIRAIDVNSLKFCIRSQSILERQFGVNCNYPLSYMNRCDCGR